MKTDTNTKKRKQHSTFCTEFNPPTKKPKLHDTPISENIDENIHLIVTLMELMKHISFTQNTSDFNFKFNGMGFKLMWLLCFIWIDQKHSTKLLNVVEIIEESEWFKAMLNASEIGDFVDQYAIHYLYYFKGFVHFQNLSMDDVVQSTTRCLELCNNFWPAVFMRGTL